MRIVFMGTPEFAVASLAALIESDNKIVAVVTSPDKPAGRGQHLQESAVKKFAASKNILVLQPENLKNDDFVQTLRSLNADVFVVVAFRKLPEEIWKIPPAGTINLHASLLPQYRGAAPINWAIINGETITGTTVFFINNEIDKGNIISYNQETISPTDNAGALHDRLMRTGAIHLTNAIGEIISGSYKNVPQDSITQNSSLKKAPKIFRETCEINWNNNTTDLHNFIRGLSPYPCAWTKIKDGKLTLKIIEAKAKIDCVTVAPGTIDTDKKTYIRVAAKDGWIYIHNLQLEGKKSMNVIEFLRGNSLT